MDKAYHPAILYRTAEDFYEFAVAHCVEETLQIEVEHIDVAIIDYFVESLDSYWIFHIAHIFPQSYIFSTKLPNDYSYLFNNDKYFRNTDGLLWFVKNVLPHVDIDFKILEIIVLLNANRASSNSAQNIVTTQHPYRSNYSAPILS